MLLLVFSIAENSAEPGTAKKSTDAGNAELFGSSKTYDYI